MMRAAGKEQSACKKNGGYCLQDRPTHIEYDWLTASAVTNSIVSTDLSRLTPAAMMRLIFQSANDIAKSANISRADALRDGAFQDGQMITNSLGKFSPFTGEAHHECASIPIAHSAGNEAAFRQPIQDTSQRRSFVGESSVQVSNANRFRT